MQGSASDEETVIRRTLIPLDAVLIHFARRISSLLIQCAQSLRFNETVEINTAKNVFNDICLALFRNRCCKIRSYSFTCISHHNRLKYVALELKWR